MALFDDNIDYDTYEQSLINNDEQIDTGIALTDKENLNYVFESDVPVERIINQLPGFIAHITYFTKSSGKQEVYEYPDFSLDDLVVEYSRIDNLKLYIDSELDGENLKDLQGEGFINAGMRPLPGDFFLYKLYDGRLALFVVNNTEPLNYNLTEIFKISFKFYLLPDKNDLAKIKINTDKEVIASSELNNTDKEVLYDKSRYLLLNEITGLIKRYTKLWTDRVIIEDNNYTISYYDTENYRYTGDTNMEEFITNLFGITSIKNVALFNKHKNDLTILNILIDKEIIKWNINLKYEVGYVYDRLHFPFLKSFMYNQIDFFVINNNDDDNDYYILSKAFYDGILNKTKGEIILENSLEVGLYNSINDKDIPIETLEEITKEADDVIKNNNSKEIFYKIPLTIYVLRYYKLYHNYTDKYIH